jgi:uncharacterized protein YfkK (UPF0435 family)
MYFPYDSPCNVQPTMAEPISVHLVAMTTRLDHMERLLEWILPNVISLMKDPVTTDWEDEIHSPAEQSFKLESTDLVKKLESFSWPEHTEIASIMHRLHLMQEEVDQKHSRKAGDFAEQRLKLEITDLVKKLESFSWPEHIEIASIMHKLHLMQEEVNQNDWVEMGLTGEPSYGLESYCFKNVSDVYDELRIARAAAMATCNYAQVSDEQQKLDTMIINGRNVVACTIIGNVSGCKLKKFVTLITACFQRDLSVTDPDLISQLCLARHKMWPCEEKKVKENSRRRTRRRSRRRTPLSEPE